MDTLVQEEWRDMLCFFVLFFFSSRRRHTRLQGDWSSDVCSSDLIEPLVRVDRPRVGGGEAVHEVRAGRSRRRPEPERPVDVHPGARRLLRSEEHTSELQSPCNLVCRLLLEKKKYSYNSSIT